MTFLIALAPVIVLIITGQVLRKAAFLPDAAWLGIERLTYYVLFPSLLIYTLSRQDLQGTDWQSMLVVIVGTLLLSALVLITWHALGKSESAATFTSVFQGGVRFNTYIALAVAQGLYGAAGLASGSIAIGFLVVLINLACVSAFVIWGNAAARSVRSFVRELVMNPLIIACAIGWFLSLSGIGLPGFSENVFEIIGRAALPMGLLAVGAALKLDMIKGHSSSIVKSSIVQFALKPAAAALLIYYTGLGGVTASVLIIAFMTPTAPSAYILARQLGGDTQTMASIITVQTLLAFMVMPFIAIWLL
jgi:predicted permease